MKVDYDEIKKYLTVLSESDRPMLNTLEFIESLGLNQNNDKDIKVFWHNLKLINDANYIECIGDIDGDLGISFTAIGTPIIRIKSFRLKLAGNQALEAMNLNSVWLKIKDNLKLLGIAGLKQIPSLAIKLIESNN
jgi:hypothetical protein